MEGCAMHIAAEAMKPLGLELSIIAYLFPVFLAGFMIKFSWIVLQWSP